MVLGLGAGKIEVKLDKPEYGIGDTINGSCVLQLKESTDARCLRLVFQRIEGRGKHTRYVELGRRELGRARIYRSGESFDFSFPVADSAVPPIYKYSGMTGALQTFLEGFGGGKIPMWWSITVSLDLPLKLDVSGAAGVSMRRPVIQK